MLRLHCMTRASGSHARTLVDARVVAPKAPVPREPYSRLADCAGSRQLDPLHSEGGVTFDTEKSVSTWHAVYALIGLCDG